MSALAPARTCPSSPQGLCEFEAPRRFADRSGRVGEVSLVRCRNCGVGITQPPLADVAFLYEGRESQDYQPGTAGLARTIKQVAFARDARRLVAQMSERPGSVLDYGCGSGLFTRCLGDILGAQNVTGSDFHAEPPAELEGRPYVPNDRLEVNAGAFDAALMMHVLEHDDEPVALLRRVAGLVRPGGTIVLEVPNIDCIWAPVFGEAWDAWYMPFHRTHFSRISLRSVIAEAGLVVDREIDVCLPSMGRSLANVFGTRNSLPLLLAGIAAHPVQWLAEKISRRPSALRLIVRRP